MRGGGRGLAVGGGGVGVLVVVVLAQLGVDVPGTGTDPYALGPGGSEGPGSSGELSSACRTGSDANQRDDCRIVAVVNSVHAYWSKGWTAIGWHRRVSSPARPALGAGWRARQSGRSTARATKRCSSTSRSTESCGRASVPAAAHSPRRMSSATNTGTTCSTWSARDERVGSDRSGEKSGAVRLEWQADCFAGVWAANAVETGFIEQLAQTDIADGLDAAAAIGDDRIQKRSGGRVDPESWTHGSSAARQRWFQTGYRAGDPRRCDTFAAGAI